MSDFHNYAVQERLKLRYICFSEHSMDDLAQRFAASNPSRFKYFPIHWGKFPDGTDNILISGFHPRNEIAGENVIFFASFHNNDVTLSQINVLIVLMQSLIESLTIVLPFYPVGTNERVEQEGRVATANTYSYLLSNLPRLGKSTRLMIYDIHALQIRFYFHGNVLPTLHTAVPLLLTRLQTTSISAVVFPDDGSAKRFGPQFKPLHYEIIVCGKIRDGHKRKVTIQDGDPNGKDVVIVDDLVQTGGTLYECAIALKARGAKSVSCFVAHGVFPHQSWKHFSRIHGGEKAVFDHFWVTNSIPSVTNHFGPDDIFEVLDLLPLICNDLDMIS